jgi:hypothetical protein
MIDVFPLAYETRVQSLLPILFRAAAKIGGAGWYTRLLSSQICALQSPNKNMVSRVKASLDTQRRRNTLRLPSDDAADVRLF